MWVELVFLSTLSYYHKRKKTSPLEEAYVETKPAKALYYALAGGVGVGWMEAISAWAAATRLLRAVT